MDRRRDGHIVFSDVGSEIYTIYVCVFCDWVYVPNCWVSLKSNPVNH